MALFLISFFEREDPAGIPYCIGDRAEEPAEVTAIVVGGADCGGGQGAGVPARGSGRGFGRMCFNRLFL